MTDVRTFWRSSPVRFAWIILLLAGPARLQGQRMECVSPAGSKDPCTTPLRAPTELVVVRLLDGQGNPVRTAPVSFAASSGTVTAIDTTDATGTAVARWSGDDSNSLARIDVVAVVAGIRLHRRVFLGAATSPLPELSIVGASNRQNWYKDRQLRDSVSVAIGVTTSAACTSTKVFFRPFGDAQVSPDTAYGKWEDGMCRAHTRWRLGSTVGKQHLRAWLPGNPAGRVDFTANAHSPPWVGMGLAATRVSGFDRLDEVPQKFTITRIETSPTGQPVTLVYDSTVKVKKSARSEAQLVFSPVIGINWSPIMRPGFSRLRVSLSADVRKPQTDWFGGFSLPQLWDGMTHEAIDIDVQLVGHVSRRDVVTNSSACSSGAEPCNVVRKTRLVGYGPLVQLSSNTLLSNIIAAFTK